MMSECFIIQPGHDFVMYHISPNKHMATNLGIAMEFETADFQLLAVAFPNGYIPINVRALSDARSREEVNTGRELCARSIKPFERGRPWLRRTRVLWKFNGGKKRCIGVRRLCRRVRHEISCAEKLANWGKYREQRC
jgi:hypothetical protein